MSIVVVAEHDQQQIKAATRRAGLYEVSRALAAGASVEG